MNKSFKKIMSLLISAFLVSTALGAGQLAAGSDKIAIDSENFPDPVFREVLSTEDFDKNSDGYLDTQERGITLMQLSRYFLDSEKQIKTLKGIEHFNDLTTLYCGSVGLEELDVSKLTKLKVLTCMGNNLSTLNLSMNYNLMAVNCSGNMLTEIKMPTSSSLTTFQCYSNLLKSLDVFSIPNLEVLRCDQNQLQSIDFTANTKLNFLNCSYNCLTSIDLSKTAISTVSDYEIGNQEISLKAEMYQNEKIFIPFEKHGLTAENYRGCSLDEFGEELGFDFAGFFADDVSQIDDGFSYECSPMISNVENMSVYVNVSRDFYQVSFYEGETEDSLLGKRFVYGGNGAAAPEIPHPPQCKVLKGWSDDITAVSRDMSVYPVWEDAHNYLPYGMNGDILTIRCDGCGNSYDVGFRSMINTMEGDSSFDVNADVVKDGIINAKDYAVLKQTLTKY